MDILKELRQRGIGVDEERTITIPKWQDAMSLVLPSVINEKEKSAVTEMLDFSKMPELGVPWCAYCQTNLHFIRKEIS